MKTMRLYISLFFLAMQLVSYAADDSLKKLPHIARALFPDPIFNERWEHRQSQCPIDPIKLTVSRNKYEESRLGTLPEELLRDTLMLLTARGFFNTSQTCQFLYHFSKNSAFHLNGYILSERRPHIAPLSSLLFRVSTTREGIFMLANLQSVTEENLRQWFGIEYLRSSATRRPLPATLIDMSESDLKLAYPTIKIILAAYPDQNEPKRISVFQLINRSFPPDRYTSSVAECRLTTFRSDMDLLTLVLVGGHKLSRPGSYSMIDVAYQQLIANGQHIGSIIPSLLKRSLLIRPALTDLVQCCADHKLGLNQYLGENLIELALSLKRPDLADILFNQLLETSPDPFSPFDLIYLRVRLGAFCLYAEDKRFQSKANSFCIGLQRDEAFQRYHDGSMLRTALRLCARTHNDNLLRVFLEEFLSLEGQVFGDESTQLIKDLITHKYHDEARQVVQLFLTRNQTNYFCLMGLDISEFFRLASELVEETTIISALRDLVDSPAHPIVTKLDALAHLTKQDKSSHPFLEQTLNVLKQEKSIGEEEMERLARVYYVLGNKEQCKFYFNKTVDLMILDFGSYNRFLLESFEKSGIRLSDLTKLKELDPWINSENLIELYGRLEAL
jgi:hypothetical protein